MDAPCDDALMLRQFLAGRDEPCPQCGYNVRDLVGSRCPECGEELALRLQLVEPKQAAALAGLIGLMAGAGMNLMLLGYVVITIFFMDRSPGISWLHPFVTINASGLVVLGICLFFWLKYWRRIRQLGAVRRWMLAGTCAILSLADLIVFTKLIR